MRMIKTPQFDFWLRIQTGRIAVVEDNLASFAIPDHEVKIEAKIGGRWTEVQAASLT